MVFSIFHANQRYLVFCPEDIASRAGHDIVALGDEALSNQVFTWISDAERNQPFLKGGGRDAFGKFRGELVVSEGWRKLQELGIKKGCVSLISVPWDT